ncbi:MAG: hypothetical protein OXF11_15260 [Deltaproteobacteria bacterium]|nr:hypothetical protein [Deltaproteobacteria bacterium]
MMLESGAVVPVNWGTRPVFEAVLGHPANSLLWLMSKGVELGPGDMVSVGSFGRLFPPAKGNGGASVTYSGPPGEPTVRVTFK